MNKFHMLASVGLAVLAFAPPMAAQAQNNNTIGDVVVTATKTGATNLQKTAISVSVIGGDVLDKSKVVTLRDLPSAVASLKISNNGSNVVPYIRGIGGYASNNEQDVGLYMDGIYLGRSTVALTSNFNDLARVEVVKGPQGSTFGRNAVGGAINFISREPSKEFQFQNTINVGNYNLIDEAVRMSGSVTDKMQAGIAVGYQKHDGYLINVAPGQSPIGAVNRTNVRVSLKYEITENLTNLVRADTMYTHEAWAPLTTLLLRTDDPRQITCSSSKAGLPGATPNSACGAYVFNGLAIKPGTNGAAYSASDPGAQFQISGSAAYAAPLANAKVGNLHYFGAGNTGIDSEINYGISDELTWKINDNISIKNLLGYRTATSSYITPTGNGTEYLTGSTHSVYEEHAFSDEININHTFGNLKGVIGLFGWTEYEHQFAPSITIVNPTKSSGSESYQDTRFPTQSYAIFASESYHFTPELALTLGGRYTQEHKVFDTYNNAFAWKGGLPAGWNGADPNNPAQQGILNTPANQTATNYVCTNGGTYSAGTKTCTPVSGSTSEIDYYHTSYSPFVAGFGTVFPIPAGAYQGIGPQLSQDSHAFTPKVGLEWQATPDAFLYATWSKGFKSGGFNFTARSPVGLTYQPEWITSYEIGAKTDWFDKRLRVNVSVFRNDWSNLQISQAIVLPNLTVPFTQSSNAAAARLTGLDADITAKPWDGWTFTSSVTWLPDATYTDFNSANVGTYLQPLLYARGDPRYNYAKSVYNASGKRLQNAPDISAIITGQKDFDLGNGQSLFVRAEGAYTGDTYFDISNDPISRRNPFGVYNASMGYSTAGGHYQIQLWARNFTDTQYTHNRVMGGTVQGVPGAPRTFGVQLNYTY